MSLVGVQPYSMASAFRVIGHGDAEKRRLSCEYGIGAGKTHFEPDEIALALMHRHEAKPDQHERQQEREIIVVVHRPQQHRECHQRKDQADAGWKYVNPSRLQARDGSINALTLSCPALNAPARGRADIRKKTGSNRGLVEKWGRTEVFTRWNQ